jgi:hypothetical protein
VADRGTRPVAIGGCSNRRDAEVSEVGMSQGRERLGEMRLTDTADGI